MGAHGENREVSSVLLGPNSRHEPPPEPGYARREAHSGEATLEARNEPPTPLRLADLRRSQGWGLTGETVRFPPCYWGPLQRPTG
jgi:hypothetical protein